MNVFMDSIYDKIIVIGTGKIVHDVLKEITEKQDKYKYETEFIKYEPNIMPLPKKLAEKINQYNIPDRKSVTEHFLDESGSVLVVSAGNNYIFPRSVVEKENITIINFHNALLPKYRGRNAATWAIYFGEEESGPTWHMVNEKVDEGGILYQKKCPVNDDMKAYELARDIMIAAYEGFRQLFEPLLRGLPIKTRPQGVDEGKMYYSYDIPHDGWFDIDDDPKDIYRLLRATDYGLTRVFPYMRAKMKDGKETEIVSYKKVKKNEIKEKEGIFIDLDEEHYLELKGQ